jgi:methylglyoxal synthase
MATVTVPARKRIAIVAHDRCKPGLLQWVQRHKNVLEQHDLYGTGTTGQAVADAAGLSITRVLSGPLGGDLQIGAMIAEMRIDVLIFFWDPLAAQPHEPDVRALLRVATVWGVPVASNPTEGDFLLSSPLLAVAFPKEVPAAGERRGS